MRKKFLLIKKIFIISISSYYYFNHFNSSKNKPFEKETEIFFYKELYKLSKIYPNLYILNIDDLFSFHGHKSCFDERNYSLFSNTELQHEYNTLRLTEKG